MFPFLLTPATVAGWWMMMAEAQMVAGMRVLALAGMVPMARGDRERMFSEKGPAMLAAMNAAAMAAMTRGSADAVMSAALRPVRRRTRANLHRIIRNS